jgi:hypothetical protein
MNNERLSLADLEAQLEEIGEHVQQISQILNWLGDEITRALENNGNLDEQKLVKLDEGEIS